MKLHLSGKILHLSFFLNNFWCFIFFIYYIMCSIKFFKIHALLAIAYILEFHVFHHFCEPLLELYLTWKSSYIDVKTLYLLQLETVYFIRYLILFICTYAWLSSQWLFFSASVVWKNKKKPGWHIRLYYSRYKIA